MVKDILVEDMEIEEEEDKVEVMVEDKEEIIEEVGKEQINGEENNSGEEEDMVMVERDGVEMKEIIINNSMMIMDMINSLVMLIESNLFL